MMDARGDKNTHSRQQMSSGKGSQNAAPKSSATRPIWSLQICWWQSWADPGYLKLLQRAHSCSKRSKNLFHSYGIGHVSVAVKVDLGGWKKEKNFIDTRAACFPSCQVCLFMFFNPFCTNHSLVLLCYKKKLISFLLSVRDQK